MAQLIKNLFSFFVCVGTYSLFFVFFFFNFILFLQYCISFAQHRNESATGIPVLPILNPPPSPYPPSGPSQCTSPKHPASRIEPGLVGDLGSVLGLGRSPGEGTGNPLQYSWASLVSQLVKHLPTMQETWVQFLG